MSEREFEDFLRAISEHLGRDVRREAIADELRDHLDERFTDLSAAGVSRDEAVRLVLDEFGEAPTLAGNFTRAGRERRRRMAGWSGATVVSLALGIIVLWAMWPERARVPLAPSLVAQAEQAAAENDVRLPEAEAKVESALATPTTVDFVETSLVDVADFLSDLHNLPIAIDSKSLEEYGIGRDAPVTLNIRNLRLETVLDRLTSGVLNLTWTYRDETLEITTPDTADAEVVTRVYHIDDVLAAGTRGDAKEVRRAGEDLVSILEACIAPDKWENAGGPGKAVVNEGTLIVTQSWRLQREIRQFLREVRKDIALANAKARDPKLTLPISLPEPWETKRRIDAVLQKSTTVDFVDTSLSDVLSFLQDQEGIHFVLDQRALTESGIAADVTVTIKSKGASVQSLLNRLTRELQLAWTVAHESIVITTPDEVSSGYVTPRLYPVGDLIAADDQDARVAGVETLIELITTNLGRTTSGWSVEGGIGAARALGSSTTIVIAQTDAVHRQVERFLTDLRASRRQDLTRATPAKSTAVVVQVYWVQSQDNAEQIDLAQLAEMIRAIVEPESWRNEPQAYVEHVGNRLVVRHTAACQRKVAKFLTVDLGLNASLVQPGQGGGFGGGGGGGGFF